MTNAQFLDVIALMIFACLLIACGLKFGFLVAAFFGTIMYAFVAWRINK